MTQESTGQTLHQNRRFRTAGRRARRLAWGAAFAVFWALMGLGAGHAQEPKHPEYEVKAAYLYNFGNFVEWPAKSTESMGDAFTICVLGQDPFGPVLDATVVGETIGGKKVVAKRLTKSQE